MALECTRCDQKVSRLKFLNLNANLKCQLILIACQGYFMPGGYGIIYIYIFWVVVS